ncbi:MAG: helix-turn-helix domain-containing protein, partial [Ghiorsea sp.]
MNRKTLEIEIEETTFAKEALQCEVGEKLIKAKIEKNLSSEFIIKELKFSQTFLEALETGNWNLLPGEVYALGFLRQYAALLNLDVSDDIEHIKSNTFELTKPQTYPDEGISPNPKWVVLAIVLFLAVIIIFNLLDSDDNQDTQIKSEVTEQNNIEQQAQSTIEAVAPTMDTYVETITTAVMPPQAEPAPLLEEEAVIDKKTYSFYAATNDVWLQVFEINKAHETLLLREVLLKKGQSFSIIDTPSKLLLTAGNPRSLEILEGNNILYAAGALGK